MITKSISEGFRFALSAKRILPYLILDLIVAYILIGFSRDFIGMIRTGSIPVLLLSMGIFIPVFIILGLAYLWVNGAIIDQAKYFPRSKPLLKSFEYSTSRFFTLLCAFVLYAIIIGIVAKPPYLGPLFAFVGMLIFFFIYPVIILEKKGCIQAFERSFKTFARHPLETFVTWLLVTIIGFIIVGIFTLPLIFYVLGSIIETLPLTPFGTEGVLPRAAISTVIQRVIDSVYSPFFIPYLVIFLVALAFNRVFHLGTQARLYMHSRKIESV
jgi:uncharacterized membrane protein YobD (UPF0266 family)